MDGSRSNCALAPRSELTLPQHALQLIVVQDGLPWVVSDVEFRQGHVLPSRR